MSHGFLGVLNIDTAVQLTSNVKICLRIVVLDRLAHRLEAIFVLPFRDGVQELVLAGQDVRECRDQGGMHLGALSLKPVVIFYPPPNLGRQGSPGILLELLGLLGMLGGRLQIKPNVLAQQRYETGRVVLIGELVYLAVQFCYHFLGVLVALEEALPQFLAI